MNQQRKIEKLQLNYFLPHSRANGPGTRAVIWVQGCSLGCPGCFNPETHSFAGGEWVRVEDMFKEIVVLNDTIEGITLSGGEPLQQRDAVTALLRRVKTETTLSTILFSGFTWEEIQAMPRPEFLQYIDVLIAGRYNASQRMARGLRGSANKTVHFLSDRYTPNDINTTPTAEIMIKADGEIVVSGIDPPILSI